MDADALLHDIRNVLSVLSLSDDPAVVESVPRLLELVTALRDLAPRVTRTSRRCQWRNADGRCALAADHDGAHSPYIEVSDV